MKKLMLVLLVFLSANALFAQGYNIGDIATDFKLKNVDGKMVSLTDFKDARGFIVIFTCNHCPYAVAYQDRIIGLDKMFKPKGYPVIAINPNDNKEYPEDSYENMIVRSKEKGFTFPYLFDEGQKIYPEFGATRTPHVFILKKEEKGLVVKYIGAIDNNHADASAVTEKYVENAVNGLLKGNDPFPATTKAIGCSIKPAK
jgi:peroxiredoxin